MLVIHDTVLPLELAKNIAKHEQARRYKKEHTIERRMGHEDDDGCVQDPAKQERQRMDYGDMQLIGNETEPMLNLPEKIVLPSYFTMSLNAFLYFPIVSALFSGKPPSLCASGCLKSSLRSSIGLQSRHSCRQAAYYSLVSSSSSSDEEDKPSIAS